MAATTALCTSFKVEVLKGLHDFTTTTGDVFKVCLIKDSMAGTYGAATTNYSDVTGNSDELAASGGYTTGGKTLTNVTPTAASTTAIVDFADASWTAASFTAAAALIYNSSDGNAAVAVIDFGGAKTVEAGTFSLIFPAAAAATAIVRIA